MGKKLTVIVDDNLDKKFREAVFHRKGLKRGNLTDAVEEAMVLWIGMSASPEVEGKERT